VKVFNSSVENRVEKAAAKLESLNNSLQKILFAQFQCSITCLQENKNWRSVREKF
jgi:hypothetical protein